MQVLDQQIELTVTASVGPVWSGQHLAHNAQRHNAPAHSTHYFAITIEEKKLIIAKYSKIALIRIRVRASIPHTVAHIQSPGGQMTQGFEDPRSRSP